VLAIFRKCRRLRANPNVATKFKYEKYATFGYFISKPQNLSNGFFQNFRIPRNFKGKAWDILKIYSLICETAGLRCIRFCSRRRFV